MAIIGFDANQELKKIRDKKHLYIQKVYETSKLEKLNGEIIKLRQAGGTYQEISDWLNTLPPEKRIKAHPSTIMRYLKKNGI